MNIFFSTLIIVSLFILSCERKDAPQSDQQSRQSTRVQNSGNASHAVNTHCMVEPEHEIDPKVTVVHEGKTYGFCCEDCIPKFQKEPAKYLAAFEASLKETKTN